MPHGTGRNHAEIGPQHLHLWPTSHNWFKWLAASVLAVDLDMEQFKVNKILGVTFMVEAFLAGFIVFAAGSDFIIRTLARSADVLHGEFIYGRERQASFWSRHLSAFRSSGRVVNFVGGKL